jgi:O-antigen ligase/tetratricopeptide (TPR) repeat protein
MARFFYTSFLSPQSLALVVILVTTLLGGGYHLASQGALLVVIGVWTFWSPPEKGVSYTISIGWLALLGWAIIQMLPLGIFPRSEWRELASQLEIPLAAGISPQPFLTAEILILIVAGMLWFYQMVSLPVNSDRRQTSLSLFALTFGLVGFAVFYLTITGVRNPLAPEVHNFSFLPNRNQMSLILAAAGIVGFGLTFENFLKRRWEGLLFLAAVLCLCFGLAGSLSRSGILIFLLGCGVWLFLATRNSRMEKEWKWLGPFLLWIFLGLLFLGGNASERLRDFLAGGVSGLEKDFRVELYRDTLAMWGEHFWTGIGLGNFETIFPQFREFSISPQVALHPESSLLWFASEAGFIGLLAVAILIYGMLRGIFDTDHHFDRYRQISIVALTVCCLQAFIDVPLHRLGVFMLLAFLYGLARVSNRRPHQPLWLPWWIWRGAGAVVALVGLCWMVAAIKPIPVHSVAVERIATEAVSMAIFNQQVFAVTNSRVRTLGQWSPMSWKAPFLLARLSLLEEDEAAAVAAFRQVRFIEPHQGPVAMAMGSAILPYNYAEAVNVFREALTHRVFLEEDRIFLQVRRQLAPIAAAQPSLERLSHLRPQYRVEFLLQADASLLASSIEQEFQARIPFNNWPQLGLERLLARYIRLSYAKTLLAFFDLHRGFADRNWKLEAKALSAVGEFNRADAIIQEHIEPPVMPIYGRDRSIPALRGLMRINPRDYAAASALVVKYYESGQSAEALLVLEQIPEFRQTPGFLNYWRARLLWETGRQEEAWEYWDRYLHPPAR